MGAMERPSAPFEVRLSREMRLTDITMIGIGAGIFVLTGTAAGEAGPALLITFALNGFVALLTALAYAELGSSFHDAGGGYLWVKTALPDLCRVRPGGGHGGGPRDPYGARARRHAGKEGGPGLRQLGILPLLATCALGACGRNTRGNPGATSDTFTTADSSGVQVVSNVTPSWAPGAGWTVDSVPELLLTTATSGPEAEFSAVTAAARFPDGRIAAADEASDEIRLFGSDGRFLGKITPAEPDSGGAPGPSRLWAVPPDTVVALYEDDHVRWLSTGGAILREDSLAPPEGGSWDEVALLDDGTFVGTLGVSTSEIDASVGGLQRVPTPLLRVDPHTGRTETLAILPGLEIFAQSMGGRTMLGIPPLGRQTMVRADGDRILTGTDEGMAYELRGLDGTVVRRVRIEGYDLSGADTMAARILDARLADVKEPAVRELMRRAMGQIPVPAERPAYSDILVSPDGHVWVGKHRGPRVQMPPMAWEVFDADGRWLGTVGTPPGLHVLAVGDENILGTVGGGRQVGVFRIDEGAGP